MIKKEMSLGEVVKQFPGSTEIFNEYRIDYCCGGKDNLEEALVENNIDVDDFLLKLNDAKEQYEANQKSKLDVSRYALNTQDLIDVIEETHHEDERKLLYKLDALINKILIVHYEDHSKELLKVHSLFADLKKELEEHFVKEEYVVFPHMKQVNVSEKNDETTISLIKELQDEHEAAGEIIKELQKVTNNFTAPADACPTYILTYETLKKLVEDIFIHIYTETSVLFERFENQK